MRSEEVKVKREHENFVELDKTRGFRGRISLHANGKEIGRVSFKSSFYRKGAVEIGTEEDFLFVHNEFRRRGFGGRLMHEAVDYIAEIMKKTGHQTNVVYCETAEWNKPARRINEKLGFENLGRLNDDECGRTVVYRKKLDIK